MPRFTGLLNLETFAEPLVAFPEELLGAVDFTAVFDLVAGGAGVTVLVLV